VLSGQLPHSGSGQMAVLASKLERNANRLSDAARVPVPEGLEGLLSRLLAREPAARFGSALEVREEWRALGPPDLMPHPSAGVVPLPPGERATEAGLASGTIQIVHRRASRIEIALGTFAVTLSCFALAIIVWLRHERSGARADFAAGPDPVVSARVVERPPVDVTDLPLVPNDWADASPIPSAPSPSAPASSAPDSPSPGPKPGPTRLPRGTRPVRGGPMTPHIADKPRY